MTGTLRLLVLTLGSLGHAWGFALAPVFCEVQRARDGFFKGWRAHVLTLVCSLLVLGLAQDAGAWVFGPATPEPVRTCWQVLPAKVCRSHVADVHPASESWING